MGSSRVPKLLRTTLVDLLQGEEDVDFLRRILDPSPALPPPKVMVGRQIQRCGSLGGKLRLHPILEPLVKWGLEPPLIYLRRILDPSPALPLPKVMVGRQIQ